MCRLWRWTIDDLASSISCCSLRKARRAAYTVAYSLSLSPTSPGRTRAAARSVIAGCPECSASLSIFLLLCLPDAVSMEIKLSARRQLISVGVMERPGATSSGSSACCRARLRRRLARGDKLRTGCIIHITTLQQTIYILRRSCIHGSYIIFYISIYRVPQIGCRHPVSAPCRVAAPLKLRLRLRRSRSHRARATSLLTAPWPRRHCGSANLSKTASSNWLGLGLGLGLGRRLGSGLGYRLGLG